ncbi:NifX-associated nitrogen fixation protein [Fortiea contorta]|uniref:NifX-associated nitrogen fixation protein n=1 Tax=Fortiea contorta TaxID=1892405 RepID=UPI00034D2E8C|nr:NifX-associated nitrogen fixation protein [Fortiea contorta]
MSTDNNLNGVASTAVLNSPFLKAIVQQIRGQDSYGVYRNWADELILKPYVVSKQKKREIPIDGEVDPVTKLRIMSFYRAVAACIEQETGMISQVIVDLSHEGFGWVLVFSGRLLLVCRTLRDAHRFGFDSLEKVAEEGKELVEKGVDLVRRFPEVGNL